MGLKLSEGPYSFFSLEGFAVWGTKQEATSAELPPKLFGAFRRTLTLSRKNR
jgi:hypothetical protein